MHSGGEIEWLFPPHGSDAGVATADDSELQTQEEHVKLITTEILKQEDATVKSSCSNSSSKARSGMALLMRKLGKKASLSKLLRKNVGSEINEKLLLHIHHNEGGMASTSSSSTMTASSHQSQIYNDELDGLDQYLNTSSHLEDIPMEEIFMDDFEFSNTSSRSQTSSTTASSTTNGNKESQPTCTTPKTEVILDDLNDRHRQMMHIVKGVDAVAHNFNLAPSTPDQRYLNHYIRDNDDCSSSSGKARTLSDQESDFSSERGDFESEQCFQFSNDHLDNYVFLPDELCYKIFSYLDYEFVVLTISRVNRQFLSVSNSGGFWIPFIKSRKCSESINILSHYLYSAPSIRSIAHQSKTEDTTTTTTTNESITDTTEQDLTENAPITSQTDTTTSSHVLSHDPVNHLTIYRTLFLSFLYHKRNLKRWFFITEANYYLLFVAPLALLTFLFLASYVFPVFPQFYKLNLFQANAEKSVPNPSLLTDNPLTRRPTIYIEGIGETFSKFALGLFGLCVCLIICSFLLIKPLTTRVLKTYSLTNVPPEDCSMFTKSIISKVKQSDSSSLIRSPTEVLPLSLRKKLFRNILGHEMLWTQEHFVRNMMLLPLLICILSVMLKNFIYIPVISESYHVVLSSPAYLIILVLIKKHWYMVFKTQGFFSILICYACFHFLMNQLKWDMLIRPMFYFLGQVVGVWAYIILNFWVLGGPNSSGIPCAN
ncbi:hypothetical protein FDP41_009633 [Naegleria fowleri]|uniref:F-box domain-containing protein n=1 Tax=Naegleria fowleri TaxID=5763 RepID=A0A6A5B014_NAEFO|nr:uncharacterized protein FDP41_009633 [Naegleria fowleri]KAF0971937.1 hypothetical protein FDP41_009633 [Naegleria fowleri]CAG4716057.1 unnamed protein product [Naegleria fowleri]